mgnify:CR=1 FL=1
MTYYDNNYKRFIDRTLNINMETLYKPFHDKLKKGSKVLDIGCGSGRDIKYFNDIGYKPIGIEPSKQMAEFARKYSGCEVIETTIQEFQSESQFDGLWACASLLHLKTNELIAQLQSIAKLMHNGSVFYCSFKFGDYEGERDGRFFNDQTIESFSSLLPNTLSIDESWITEDLRPATEQKWLNMLLSLKIINANY